MNNSSLVQYLLEKKEIVLPTILLKQKMILELEENLRKISPIPVSNFFKKVYDNFDKYIDINGANKIFEIINEISHNENFQQDLSIDSEKIIGFLIKETKLENVDVIEIIGQQFFMFQVLIDLEKNKDRLPNILNMVLFMWCFVNIYELLLHEIDRRLFNYFKNKKKNINNNPIRKFLSIKREKYKDHASADLINKVICAIINLKEDNDSIFGKTAKPKLIRNKISHFNMFYDSEKNKIVLLNGQEYDIKEFLNEFYKIFNFLFQWIKRLNNNNFTKEKLISDIKTCFKALSSEYLRIERSGLRRDYSGFIIKLKREAGIKNE